jgi:hypothetical protein
MKLSQGCLLLQKWSHIQELTKLKIALNPGFWERAFTVDLTLHLITVLIFFQNIGTSLIWGGGW